MNYKSPKLRSLNAQHEQEGGIKPVMLHLYDQGMTYPKLAEHFSLPVHVVGYYMRQFLAEREGQSADQHAARE